MAVVASQITAMNGAVPVPVNQARFEAAGALEEIPLAKVRRRFETNFLRPGQFLVPRPAVFRGRYYKGGSR